jgi:hypothetical protein
LRVTPQEILTVAVNVDAPVTGNVVNRIATGENGYSCSLITWSPADSTFRANTRYTATMTLTADSGRYFAENITDVTINGYTARVVRNTGTQLMLSYSFAAT